MLQAFKNFVLHGSMVDMAVGIVVGAAFGEVVSSFVGDIIMPPIGVLLGGMDFSSLAFTLQAATPETPAVVIAYGKFIQTTLNFTIVAFSVFMAIKGMNTLRDSHQTTSTPPPDNTPSKTALLIEIRDLLQAQASQSNPQPTRHR
jgi:large conductance mechanosensitive channel